jgi:hypothetical protein
MGAVQGAVAGGAAGGIGAGAGANNSGAFNIGNDNEDKALAISTGIIGGALVGAILGHCILDEPAPPPPPPPPPPSPPAPVVQKRIVLRGVNFDFDKSNIRADAATLQFD